VSKGSSTAPEARFRPIFAGGAVSGRFRAENRSKGLKTRNRGILRSIRTLEISSTIAALSRRRRNHAHTLRVCVQCARLARHARVCVCAYAPACVAHHARHARRHPHFRNRPPPRGVLGAARQIFCGSHKGVRVPLLAEEWAIQLGMGGGCRDEEMTNWRVSDCKQRA
jgi:hypothetical protein